MAALTVLWTVRFGAVLTVVEVRHAAALLPEAQLVVGTTATLGRVTVPEPQPELLRAML